MKLIIFTLIVSLTGAAFSKEINSKPLQAAGAIKVDGKLEESEWAGAEFQSEFSILQRQGGGAALPQTKFKVLHDDEAIYLGVICEEPLMKGLVDASIPRNGPAWARDAIEIFIAPDGGSFNYYHFIITAGNDQFQEYRIESGKNIGGEYHAALDSAVTKNEKEWILEVRIPLTAFYKTPAEKFAAGWKFNVARNRVVESQPSSWVLLESAFNESTKYGTLKGVPSKKTFNDLDLTGLSFDQVEPSGEKYKGILSLKYLALSQEAIPTNARLFLEGHPEKGIDLSISGDSLNAKTSAFEFNVLGTQWVRLDLLNSTKKVLGSYYKKVAPKFSPVEVKFSSPRNRNLDILPWEKVSSLSGEVRAVVPVGKDEKILLEVKGGSFKSKPIELAAESKFQNFQLPIESLPEGDYVVSASLKTNSRYKVEFPMRKLPKPPGGYSYVDEQMNLVVDGKPQYVRAFFGDENFLLSYKLKTSLSHPYTPYTTFFGGSVVVCMEAERLDRANHGATEDREPTQLVYDEMKKLIDENISRKDFYYYYLCDEPECRGISPVYLKYQYDFIKKYDPYRIVMVASRDPERFVQVTDVMPTHPYISPVVDEKGKRTHRNSIKQTKDFIQRIIKAGEGKVAPWNVSQAMTYAELDMKADYPTFDEFRAVVFSGVVNGSKGDAPFFYGGMFSSLDLRAAVDFTYESLAKLEPFLISSHEDSALKISVTKGEAEGLFRKVGNQALMIFVNLSDQELEATIGSEELKKYSSFEFFQESGKVDTKSGSFTLKLKPYDVRILTNTRIDQGMRTVEKVRLDLAKANENRKKPGNLLFNIGHKMKWNSTDPYHLVGDLSLVTLTDGVDDAYGFGQWTKPLPCVIQGAFLKKVPKFKTIKIYSSTAEDLTLSLWKEGEWVKWGEVKGNTNDVIVLHSPELTSTVKIKIEITKVRKEGMKAEVYEVEMYAD